MSSTDALSDKRAKTSGGGLARLHPMVGSMITKLFHDDEGRDKWYSGTVTSYDPAAKYFKVRYTDGDEEELDEEEIYQHSVHLQHPASSDEDEDEEEESSGTVPSASQSAATGKRKRTKHTKPILHVIQDHPKQDKLKLPGWKLRTDTNPILHISPTRKIPFRNFKVAKRFDELAQSKGEYAAFDVIEAEYRSKKRKNGRDAIYSVVSALPRDDRRCRHHLTQEEERAAEEARVAEEKCTVEEERAAAAAKARLELAKRLVAQAEAGEDIKAKALLRLDAQLLLHEKLLSSERVQSVLDNSENFLCPYLEDPVVADKALSFMLAARGRDTACDIIKGGHFRSICIAVKKGLARPTRSS